jgi:hypothetical protein
MLQFLPRLGESENMKELKSVQIIKQLKLEYDSKIDHALCVFYTEGKIDELYKVIAQLLKDFESQTGAFVTDTQRGSLQRAIDEYWK